jgi:hypothetical protein
MKKIHKKLVDELVKQMADDGRLIESGWVALRSLAIPADASDVQISEMRMAYMAGAQHLFTTIMVILDPGMEPTDEDLRRMELINKELDVFGKELKLRFGKSEGSA